MPNAYLEAGYAVPRKDNRLMDIVLCADEAYLDKAAAVIASVLCHSRHPQALRFHLLGYGITDASRARLENWFKTLPASLLLSETCEASPRRWSQLSLGRFGPAAMQRLSMERWLPAGIRRVLYLDCDVLVLDDVATLMDVDMQQRPIAAVMNLQSTPQDRLGIPYSRYFNSGVLLIDLECWIAREVLANAEQHFTVKPETPWRYPDQDVLNLIFPDWHPLPLRWNMQPYAYPAIEKHAAHYGECRQELLDAVSRPAVVHFIGATKPWHMASRHPLTPLFRDYLRLTPWPLTLEGKPEGRLRRTLRAPRIWRRRRRLQHSPVLSLPLDGPEKDQ